MIHAAPPEASWRSPAHGFRAEQLRKGTVVPQHAGPIIDIVPQRARHFPTGRGSPTPSISVVEFQRRLPQFAGPMDKLLPPVAGRPAALRQAEVPSDRTACMATGTQHKPPSPATALLSTMEASQAISAIVDGDEPLPLREPEPEPEPSSPPQLVSFLVSPKPLSTSPKNEDGSPPAASSATTNGWPSTTDTSTTSWPAAHRGTGPAPLAASPSRLHPTSPERTPTKPKGPVKLFSPGSTRKEAGWTRSGAFDRVQEAYVAPSGWISPDLARLVSAGSSAPSEEKASPARFHAGYGGAELPPVKRPTRKKARKQKRSEDYEVGNTSELASAALEAARGLEREVAVGGNKQTRTLYELGAEATARRKELEALLGSIAAAEQEVIEGDKLLAKSAGEREDLRALVSEVSGLIERVHEVEAAEDQEWATVQGKLKKKHAKRRWGAAKQKEWTKVGGLLDGNAQGEGKVSFRLKGTEATEAKEEGEDHRAGWTWADTEAAKLKLAKRRQAEAAKAEVQRLQELLSGYHSRLEESGKRVEEEEVRLREEKRQAVARGKARTQEMQRRRAAQFEQAAEQRAANAAANAELFSEQRAATVAAREEMIQARSAARARKVEASKERRRLVAEKERQEAERAQRRLDRERDRPIARYSKKVREQVVIAVPPPPPHPRAAAHAQLAASYASAGLHHKAMQELEQAQQIGGGFLEELQARAAALAGLGRFTEGLAALDEALAIACLPEATVDGLQAERAEMRGRKERAEAAQAEAAQPLY